MHANDILAHLSDDHPTKDLAILKPYCVLQTGRIRYRTQRYGISWDDVAGGATSLILMPHSWLLVGREDLKKVDHAHPDVSSPGNGDRPSASQRGAAKRTSSGQTKHVYWRSKPKVENDGATQKAAPGNIRSSSLSADNVVACVETRKPDRTAAGVVRAKPVTTAEKGLPASMMIGKQANSAANGRTSSVVPGKPTTTAGNSRPATVMSAKPISTIEKSHPASMASAKLVNTTKKSQPASMVSVKLVNTVEKSHPANVVSAKPIDTTDKSPPTSVVSAKPVSTTETSPPVSVVSAKPVSNTEKSRPASVSGLVFVTGVTSHRWNDDVTFSYKDSSNFVSPRTMSPQCTPRLVDSGTSTKMANEKQTSTTTFLSSNCVDAATATGVGDDDSVIISNTVDNSTSTIPGYDVTPDGSVASGAYFSEDTSRQFASGTDVPAPRQCRTTSGRYMSNEPKVQLPDSVVRGLENMSAGAVNPAKCILARGSSLTDKKVCSEFDIPMLSRVLLANAVRAGESEQTTVSDKVGAGNYEFGTDARAIRTSDNQTGTQSQSWKDFSSNEGFVESPRVKQHVTHVGHSQSQKDQSVKGATDDGQSTDSGVLTTWAWEDSHVTTAGLTGTADDCSYDEPGTGETNGDLTEWETCDIQSPRDVKRSLRCEDENVTTSTDKLPPDESEAPQPDIVLCSSADDNMSDGDVERIEPCAPTTGASDRYPATYENVEFESTDDDSTCNCCGAAEQFMYKKLSAEPDDDDITSLVDALGDSQALRWLFRVDDDDNDNDDGDVTMSEPTPIRHFEMNKSIVDEMTALFPSVVPVLRSAGRLADWVHFMQVLSDDRCLLPPDDVTDLEADVRLWHTPQSGAYTDGRTPESPAYTDGQIPESRTYTDGQTPERQADMNGQTPERQADMNGQTPERQADMNGQTPERQADTNGQTPERRADTDGQTQFWTLADRLFRAHSDFIANHVGRQSQSKISWHIFDE